jgi:hypothetical protein
MTEDNPLLTEVKLRNGQREARAVVEGFMNTLYWLEQANFTALLMLVEICHNSSYRVRDDLRDVYDQLKDTGLVEDGTSSDEISVHDSVRNVVTSAARGNGFLLELTSPYADED